MRLKVIDRLLCHTCSTSEITFEDKMYLEEDVNLHKITKCLLKLVPFQPSSLEHWTHLFILWQCLLDSYQQVYIIRDQQHVSLLLDKEDQRIYPEYLNQVSIIYIKMAHKTEQHSDRIAWLSLLDRFKEISMFPLDSLALLSSL
jgi:hypothetical protein